MATTTNTKYIVNTNFDYTDKNNVRYYFAQINENDEKKKQLQYKIYNLQIFSKMLYEILKDGTTHQTDIVGFKEQINNTVINKINMTQYNFDDDDTKYFYILSICDYQLLLLYLTYLIENGRDFSNNLDYFTNLKKYKSDLFYQLASLDIKEKIPNINNLILNLSNTKQISIFMLLKQLLETYIYNRHSNIQYYITQFDEIYNILTTNDTDINLVIQEINKYIDKNPTHENENDNENENEWGNNNDNNDNNATAATVVDAGATGTPTGAPVVDAGATGATAAPVVDAGATGAPAAPVVDAGATGAPAAPVVDAGATGTPAPADPNTTAAPADPNTTAPAGAPAGAGAPADPNTTAAPAVPEAGAVVDEDIVCADPFAHLPPPAAPAVVAAHPPNRSPPPPPNAATGARNGAAAAPTLPPPAATATGASTDAALPAGNGSTAPAAPNAGLAGAAPNAGLAGAADPNTAPAAPVAPSPATGAADPNTAPAAGASTDVNSICNSLTYESNAATISKVSTTVPHHTPPLTVNARFAQAVRDVATGKGTQRKLPNPFKGKNQPSVQKSKKLLPPVEAQIAAAQRRKEASGTSYVVQDAADDNSPTIQAHMGKTLPKVNPKLGGLKLYEKQQGQLGQPQAPLTGEQKALNAYALELSNV